jgi:hypothetical protein
MAYMVSTENPLARNTFSSRAKAKAAYEVLKMVGIKAVVERTQVIDFDKPLTEAQIKAANARKIKAEAKKAAKPNKKK